MSSAFRRPLVVGNWKMNKTPDEGVALVRELRELLGASVKAEVAVAPPFVALAGVGAALEGGSIELAAQNCHWEASGAFTGEVSTGMLRALSCTYVIVGHSERRAQFGETDAVVNRKARAVLAAAMRPIVCVGETLEERDAEKTLSVISRQVEASLAGITAAEGNKVVVAYEPVWAIGTGRTASTAQAQEVHGHIRGLLVRQWGEVVAGHVRIQYGGSVKADNAADLLRQPDIDGALVGGASLDARGFTAIIKNACSE
jgi:triosephosphate isomerase